jgi:hypothetical protein
MGKHADTHARRQTRATLEALSPSSHHCWHFPPRLRGPHQWTVIDLLSRVTADVLQLFLCDFFHRPNYMWKGHRSMATTSGHIIILFNKKRATESLAFPSCVRHLIYSFFTENSTWKSLLLMETEGTSPKFIVRMTGLPYGDTSCNSAKLKTWLLPSNKTK